MNYAWLPKVLAEIAEVAGLDAAIAVAHARGGTEVYIPAEAADDHWLVAAAGREAADRICRHFSSGHGGVLVTLPLGPRGSAAKVRGLVDRMIAAGRPNSEIALACGYTTRGVEMRRAKARERDGGKQGRLF